MKKIKFFTLGANFNISPDVPAEDTIQQIIDLRGHGLTSSWRVGNFKKVGQDGTNQLVQDFFLRENADFIKKIEQLVLLYIDSFMKNEHSIKNLEIWFRCTHGYQRSVAMGEMMLKRLKGKTGTEISLKHLTLDASLKKLRHLMEE